MNLLMVHVQRKTLVRKHLCKCNFIVIDSSFLVSYSSLNFFIYIKIILQNHMLTKLFICSLWLTYEENHWLKNDFSMMVCWWKMVTRLPGQTKLHLLLYGLNRYNITTSNAFLVTSQVAECGQIFGMWLGQ